MCADILKLAEYVMKKGNQNALSDAAVAVRQTQAAAWGAYYNVLINLPSLEDETTRTRISAEAKQHVSSIQNICEKLAKTAEETLAHATS